MRPSGRSSEDSSISSVSAFRKILGSTISNTLPAEPGYDFVAPASAFTHLDKAEGAHRIAPKAVRVAPHFC